MDNKLDVGSLWTKSSCSSLSTTPLYCGLVAAIVFFSTGATGGFSTKTTGQIAENQKTTGQKTTGHLEGKPKDSQAEKKPPVNQKTTGQIVHFEKTTGQKTPGRQT